MRSARLLVLVLVAALLAGCGFKLRGSNAIAGRTLPYATISLAIPAQSELYLQIQRGIEASASTKVVDDVKEAAAILTVLNDSNQKSILTLSAAGRAREYQLTRTFTFRVHNAQQADYVPVSKITVVRTLPFSDDIVLSKESEEAVLWADMQKDLVNQLMRRLLASKAQPVLPAED